MAITLTPSAARQIQSSVEKFGGIGLRVGVKNGRLLGLRLHVRHRRRGRADDRLFEAHDTKVVVDSESLDFLDGSTLDFVREG